jgi:hypothetical protein
LIDKVIEVVLGKFLQPRTRKEKADDELKQRLVFLHEGLVNCHNTYKQYVSDRSDINLANWRTAVSDLAVALDNVGLALSSFSPEAFNYASRYLYDELPAPRDYSGREDEARLLEQTVMRLRFLESDRPKRQDDNEFKEATTRLREFMKEFMTAGEIQKAQDNFRRDTYQKYL